MRPVVALTDTLDFTDNKTKSNFSYERCVTDAGGLPWPVASTALAFVDELVPRIDGLLLTGGGDINPSLFGEPPIEGLGQVCPPRDELELALCRAVLKAGKPVLGICRGIQILNVAMGGTLWQDLRTQYDSVWKHAQSCPAQFGSHSVRIEPDSRLAAITGKAELYTNSCHHEAVRLPGTGLHVTASTGDGVIEAVEGESGWVLGLQWHPEAMNCDESRAIFQSFVHACEEKEK